MALKYTLRTATIMDGDDEVATVHGLSLNAIVQLIMINRDAADMLFEELSGRKPEEITESDMLTLGHRLVDQIPQFVAQIIAVAADVYDEPDSDDVSPIERILEMPAGLQIAALEKIATLTFVGTSPKKLLALAFKNARGQLQSQGA